MAAVAGELDNAWIPNSEKSARPEGFEPPAFWFAGGTKPNSPDTTAHQGADFVGTPARNVWLPPLGSAQNGGKVVAKRWPAIALTQRAYCLFTAAGSTHAATRRSPEGAR